MIQLKEVSLMATLETTRPTIKACANPRSTLGFHHNNPVIAPLFQWVKGWKKGPREAQEGSILVHFAGQSSGCL